jgi:hypothetical protein
MDGSDFNWTVVADRGQFDSGPGSHRSPISVQAIAGGVRTGMDRTSAHSLRVVGRSRLNVQGQAPRIDLRETTICRWTERPEMEHSGRNAGNVLDLTKSKTCPAIDSATRSMASDGQ